MKIAVSSTGQDLKSQVDPRFGRAPFFIVLDPDTMESEVLENPNVAAMGGAGIQTAQLIANKGIELVLTGSCGPNAFQTLQAAGVKVITGVLGTVEEAVKKYKAGQLKPTTGPNVASHYGMPPGPGFGFGMGGMGRGMGRRMAMLYNAPMQAPPPFAQMPPQQELQVLKQQEEFLKQQLEAVNRRIKELEKKK